MSSVLLQILEDNQDTEIGRRWNFKGISSIEEFRRNVPLTTYDDYKPYIDRIAENGEQNLLTNDIVVQFGPSSGTTGKMKLIPITKRALEQNIPKPNESDKNLYFTSFPLNKPTTPSGILIEGMSVKPSTYLIQNYPDNYCAPYDCYTLPSLELAVYVQLLFGLKKSSITSLGSIFIPVILTALVQLKSKWRQMLADIRSGKIDSSLPLSSDKRDVLEGMLGGPDPVRADELEAIFKQAEVSEFKGFAKAIWPNLKAAFCCCSGNMKCYIPTVQYYIGSDVCITSFVYSCTETGPIGMPARPFQETSLFRLVPTTFYEFISLDNVNEDNPSTLLANEIQEGQAYEIVLTAPTGFYRYRNGDYIKVIEQGKDGPLIDFQGRGKMTLHLREHALYEANIELAMTSFTSTISSRVDYTVSIDSTTNNRYRIWIESDELRDGLDKFIDETLQSIDVMYKYNRQNKKVEQLVISKVKPGTFSKILDFIKSRTLNVEAQLKLPRVIQNEKMQQILEENLLM